MGRHFSFVWRWGLITATLVFLGHTLTQHWQDVRTLEIQGRSWLFAALGLGLVAQLWCGCLWGCILTALQHPVPQRWSMVTFLKNSPAKYIPGSVWHFYGRVRAAQQQGLSLEFAALSVMLEPLLVIAGALGIGLFYGAQPLLKLGSLALVLLALHPRVLNPIWRWLHLRRGKPTPQQCMGQYPVGALLAATLFMMLRGLTFLCVVLAFTPIQWPHLSQLLGGFSFAWFLSLVIPAPGGLGVFEASAINILDGVLSPGLLLGAVAVYRLISILAEVLGAGVAYVVREG